MGRSIPRPIPAHRVDSHTLGSWATYLPRVLVALAVVIFVAMQLGGSPFDSASKAGKLNAVTGGKAASAHGSGSSGSGSSSSSKRGKDASSSSSSESGGEKKTRPPRAQAAAPSRKGMLCYENDLLEGCRNWLDRILARERFDLVLVANELYPTFPLKGYGGIETAVEILANALSRMNIPFWVIAPGRVSRPEYPFDVMEALDSSNGRPHMVGTFVNQAIDIIRWRADYVGAKLTLIEKLHEKVGSAPPPPNEKNRTLVIWGQSEWSQEFAPFSAVTVTAHHDGGGPLKGWDRRLENVGHRFLSHDQRDQWVNPDDVSVGAKEASGCDPRSQLPRHPPPSPGRQLTSSARESSPTASRLMTSCSALMKATISGSRHWTGGGSRRGWISLQIWLAFVLI